MGKAFSIPEIGSVFGKWTVIGQTIEGEREWSMKIPCQCECGKIRMVNVSNLIRRKTSSCSMACNWRGGKKLNRGNEAWKVLAY